MDRQPAPKPQRYWFSPSPFIRKMEAYSIVPLSLSLAASLSACALFVHSRTLPPQDYDRLGDAIGIGILSFCSLLFLAIANIFTGLAFLQLDYPDNPKGLVSKMLFRFAAGFAVVWVLLWLPQISPDFPRFFKL